MAFAPVLGAATAEAKGRLEGSGLARVAHLPAMTAEAAAVPRVGRVSAPATQGIARAVAVVGPVLAGAVPAVGREVGPAAGADGRPATGAVLAPLHRVGPIGRVVAG